MSIAIIYMLIPPIIVFTGYNFLVKASKKEYSTYLFEGIILVIIDNRLLISCLSKFFNKTEESLIEYIGLQPSFALKYLLLSIVISTLLLLLQFPLKKISHPLAKCLDSIPDWILRTMIILYTAYIIGNLFQIIHYPDFWADEVFSIDLIHKPVMELLNGTAQDVHPPLYYLILKAASQLFGYHPITYRLVSIFPMCCMIILSLTGIWKELGRYCGSIVALATVSLYETIGYAIEIRMYSLGFFFTGLSFFLFYKVLKYDNDRFLFVLASLCAAYTHYYCLLNVSFLYLSLIIIGIKKKWKIQKWFIPACGFGIGYLPWLFVFLNSVRAVSTSYWIDSVPSLTDIARYPFHTFWEKGIAFVFVLISLYTIYKMRQNKDYLNYSIFISGLSLYFGTYLIAYIVSVLVTPVILLRYMFPAVSVIWILAGIIISKSDKKQFLAFLLALLLIINGIHNIHVLTNYEKMVNQTSLIEQLEVPSDPPLKNVIKQSFLYTSKINSP